MLQRFRIGGAEAELRIKSKIENELYLDHCFGKCSSMNVAIKFVLSVRLLWMTSVGKCMGLLVSQTLHCNTLPNHRMNTTQSDRPTEYFQFRANINVAE